MKRSAPRGFTLMEVTLAGALFLLAIAGTVSAFSTAAGQVTHIERHATAVALCEGVIEDLLLLDRAAPELDPATSHSVSLAANGDPGSAYTVSWTVIPNSPIAGMRRIVVTATWQELLGNRSVSLETVRL